MHSREDTNPVIGLRGGVAVPGIMTSGEGVVLVPSPFIMTTVDAETIGVASKVASYVTMKAQKHLRPLLQPLKLAEEREALSPTQS